MMHPNLLRVVKQMEDSAGRPIYQRPMGPGQPGLIDGWPVVENIHMPSTFVGTGATVILFGAFSHYKVREVNAGELIVWRESVGLIEYDRFAAALTLRCDGMLVDPGNGPIVALQMHS